MDGSKFALVDNIINKCIADTIIPGAVVAIVRDDKLVYLKAYGNKRVYPYTEKMTAFHVWRTAFQRHPVRLLQAELRGIFYGNNTFVIGNIAGNSV